MTVRMGRKLAELADAVIGDALNRDWLGGIKRAETPGTYPGRPGVRRRRARAAARRTPSPSTSTAWR